MENLLKKGASGDSIRDLQTMLVRLGHPLKVDGVFGDETEKVVMTLQKKAGIPTDGIVGPRTRTALLAALASVGAKAQAAEKTAPKTTSS